ncbi:ABC transporter permease [Mycoplasma phocoenae]|uniref:ABC transporter permease n=1 Tax=Mycoplasma phocoenae TaxID=754517 RepID=A0A858U870_9MOLU|nr:ABC transporter permease [Mycoplasma phocoenae]QJG66958.1 ABC transporter permease [Mycoplasma phocoenae]
MKKLLKEVFKSLSKNLITVVCLTVLVFITCGLFTLLFDVKKSYTSSLNQFKKVSKMQNLTVDLDVNPNGEIVKGGYENVDADGNVTNSKEPVVYIPDQKLNKYHFKKNLLSIEPQYLNFIPISKINKTQAQTKTMTREYIDSEVFQTWFNESINNLGPVIFDTNEASVRFIDNTEVHLYTKNKDGNYIISKTTNSIKPNETITFVEEYKLADFAQVVNTPSNKTNNKLDDFLTKAKNLYINPITKTASLNYSDFQSWKNETDVVIISADKVLEQLGFIEKNNRFYFDQSKEKDFAFVDTSKVTTKTIDKNVKLSKTFTLENYIKSLNLSELKTSTFNKFKFEKDVKYYFPKNWIQINENRVEFLRHTYRLNWDKNLNEKESNWKGTYHSFIKGIYQENNNEIPADINEFSFWTKKIKNKSELLSDQNNNDSKWVSKYSAIDIDDIDVILESKNNQVTPAGLTIAKLENIPSDLNPLKREIAFKNISNTNKLQQKRNFISVGANSIAQNSIIKYVIDKVGEENVGLRQSMTVSSINEINSNKNIFHFINTGDSEYKVKNVKQNIGRLFNEQFEKSSLNIPTTENNIDDYLLVPDPKYPNRKTRIKSEYASSIIENIYKGYTPDPEYLKTDIRYIKYFTYYKGTQIPYENDGKLVILASTNERNKTMQYAITTAKEKTPDGKKKYILLRKDIIQNKEAWIKALLTEHPSEMSIEELDKFLKESKLTIRAKIGKKGWAKLDNDYDNGMWIPYIYGSVSSSAIVDITQNNSLKVLVNDFKDAVMNSDLSKMITKKHLDKFINSGQRAAERNGVHSLLSTGKTNAIVIQATLFDWVYELTSQISEEEQTINSNANIIIQQMFNNIIDFIWNQIKFDENGKQRTQDQQFEYLKQEFTKIEKLMSSITGSESGFMSSILPGVSLNTILNYFKSIDTLFISLKQLIASIDFITFSQLGHQWYKDNPYKPYTNTKAKYYTLSKDEILSFLLKSIKESKLKKVLKNIFNNIDFNKVLNPDVEGSLFKIIVNNARTVNKPFTNDEEVTLYNLFNKFNYYKDDSKKAFTNIPEAINNLIELIDLKKMIANIDSYLAKGFVADPVEINGQIYQNNFTKKITNSQKLASLISSLLHSNSDSTKVDANKIFQLQNSLIKLANLSSKTSGALGLQIPAGDDERISINDIGTFSLIRFENPNKKEENDDQIQPYDIDKITKLKQKIELAIKQKGEKLRFTYSESSFLNTVVLVTKPEFDNLELVLGKLDKYEKLIKKLDLNNIFGEFDKYDLSFDSIDKKPMSFGDYAYYSSLFNEKKQSDKKEFKRTLYNQIKPLLGALYSKNISSLISNELNLYSAWIQIAYDLYNSNPNITLSEIKKFVLSIYDMAEDKKLKEVITNYSKVKDPIPSFNSLLGSDENNYATLFKISYALANNFEATNELVKENNVLDEALQNVLTKHNISNQINVIKPIVEKNIYQLVQQWALLIDSNWFPSNYKESQEFFVNNFIDSPNKEQSLITSIYDLQLLQQHAINSSKLSKTLNVIGFNSVINNPFAILSYPQILLYTAISNQENNGNLALIVKKLFSNYESASLNQLEKLLNPLFEKVEIVQTYADGVVDENIAIDSSWLESILESILEIDEEKPVIFGLNLKNLYTSLIGALIEQPETRVGNAYNATTAYLAKTNQAYLEKNNKEIYKGDLSEYLNDPYKMSIFVSKLDAKYKITVNSLEYILVGVDTTADYLYPVIDEENLQVDVEKQALVYVNNKGFNRMRAANPTNAVKEYLLVKYEKQPKEIVELQTDISNYIKNISTSFSEKVYLDKEIDPINPERSIRITLVKKIIKSISNIQVFSLIILIVLISLSVYFVIRRYINMRSKVIGILRSQGYREYQIAFAFCSFSWLSTIVGGLLGYLTGHFAQGFAFNLFSSYWTLPTQSISFNWITLLSTLAVPTLMMSSLIFIITMLSIRLKPIEMMSGLSDLNIGKIARTFALPIRKLPIKTRFVGMLTINNFWKLFSLFISFSITALITMFSLSSMNVFDKSIQRTYQQRNYRYKLDLETPTTEGGPYTTYNKNELDDKLYIPDDLSATAGNANDNQADYNSPYYFKPGYVFNTDIAKKPFNPAVLTKSSLDILLDTGLTLSPWDVVYSSLPETQKSRVIHIFKNVSNKMMNTQYLWWTKDKTRFNKKTFGGEYLNHVYATETNDPNGKKTSFFAYYDKLGTGTATDDPLGRFMYVEYNEYNDFYEKPKNIKTDRTRIKYRNFLVAAYKSIDINDYFMSFGGVIWNDYTNEKYSYAKTEVQGENVKLYGYKDKTKYIKIIDNKGVDLTNKLYSYFDKDKKTLPEDISNTELPLVINNLTATKYSLSIGSVIELKIKNDVDRFVDQVLNLPVKEHKYKFKVIGISETYINNELITTKPIVDKIVGLDKLTKIHRETHKNELEAVIKCNPEHKTRLIQEFNDKYEAFNGLLSNDPMPEQTISTLTTYSSSGYWGAIQNFNAKKADDKSLTTFFKKIFAGFIYNSNDVSEPMLKHTIEAYNKINGTNFNYEDKIKEFLNVENDDYKSWGNGTLTGEPLAPEVRTSMTNAIEKMYGADLGIYGKDILYSASNDVNSKDIEAGFISEIANTITGITLFFIIISFVVSIIILVMITNSMVSSNKQGIATFSILGYSAKEKLYLFFFNYIPVIIGASLITIPITYILILLFNAFMMSTSQMVLPLSLYLSTILLSMIVSLLVFTITSIMAWINLNKVKPIYVLKGK